MSPEKAVELIKKLADQNLSHKEIAKRLSDAGFKSHRTRRPISPMGVGYHLRKLAEEAPTPPKEDKPVPQIVKPHTYNPRDPNTWVRRTARNPSEEKIRLAIAMLGQKDTTVRERCESAAAILLS